MKSIARYIAYITCAFLSISFSFSQQTATNVDEKTSIVDELNTPRDGQGNVIIYQDEAIKGIVGKQYQVQRTIYTSADTGEQYVRMRGYKINVFSGNDQRRSKNEAYYKKGLVSSAFPDQQITVIFNAPFWRVRAGNFKTRDEAEQVLKEMKRAFPSFGREMYIVVDEVKIPI